MTNCTSSPCLNGATCLIGSVSVSCLCPLGFSGEFCEYGSSQTCLRGSISNTGLLMKYFAIQSILDFNDPTLFTSTPIIQMKSSVSLNSNSYLFIYFIYFIFLIHYPF